MLRPISSVVRQVPTLVPRMMPSEREKLISPAFTSPMVMTVMAVLLCSSAVMPELNSMPCSGVRVERCRKRFK